MNIPNNYTNKKAEILKSAIILDLKDRVIEHRILAIVPTIEEADKVAMIMTEIHDLILISEQRRPKRKVGSSSYPIVFHCN